MLDGEGAYTAVEGEKASMSPGDFVITANWAPHDHGNTSKKPMLWLDVLDFPPVNFFEASFAEHFDEKRRRTTSAPGRRFARAFYGSGVLPDGTPTRLNRSPVINYTYARTRPILERMMKAGDIDKRHGARVRYANPVNGGPVLPTMGAQPRAVPEGLQGREIPLDRRHHLRLRRRPRHHQGRRQGAGMGPERRLRGSAVEALFAHNAAKESVLFSISDRPAQEALGIWREDTRAH